jgi:hypothetical protein
MIKEIPVIELRNTGSADSEGCRGIKDLHYPRLMRNKRGEIVLATHKKDSLTTGIYVGQVEGTKPHKLVGPVAEVESGQILSMARFRRLARRVEGQVPTFGTKWTDWEVCGELTDYDGEVTLTLKNQV